MKIIRFTTGETRCWTGETMSYYGLTIQRRPATMQTASEYLDYLNDESICEDPDSG